MQSKIKIISICAIAVLAVSLFAVGYISGKKTSTQAEIEALTAERDEYKAQVENCEKLLEDYSTLTTDYNQQIEDYTAQIADYEAQIEELSEKVGVKKYPEDFADSITEVWIGRDDFNEKFQLIYNGFLEEPNCYFSYKCTEPYVNIYCDFTLDAWNDMMKLVNAQQHELYERRSTKNAKGKYVYNDDNSLTFNIYRGTIPRDYDGERYELPENIDQIVALFEILRDNCVEGEDLDESVIFWR